MLACGTIHTAILFNKLKSFFSCQVFIILVEHMFEKGHRIPIHFKPPTTDIQPSVIRYDLVEYTYDGFLKWLFEWAHVLWDDAPGNWDGRPEEWCQFLIAKWTSGLWTNLLQNEHELFIAMDDVPRRQIVHDIDRCGKSLPLRVKSSKQLLDVIGWTLCEFSPSLGQEFVIQTGDLKKFCQLLSNIVIHNNNEGWRPNDPYAPITPNIDSLNIDSSLSIRYPWPWRHCRGWACIYHRLACRGCFYSCHRQRRSEHGWRWCWLSCILRT